MRIVARRRDDERGFTIVLVALTLVVMMTFVAFAVDLGNAKQKRRSAQNSADGAALAAARDLTNVNIALSTRYTTAVATARSYVDKNYGTVTWNPCDDSGALADQPDGTNHCISFSSNPLRVRVRLPVDKVRTAFAGAIGIQDIPVRAAAAAGVSSPLALRILPVAIPNGAGTGNLCIENSGNDTGCDKRTTGNFGDLMSPRLNRFLPSGGGNGVTSDSLRINYAVGIDHGLNPYFDANGVPAASQICDGNQTSPCTDSNAPTATRDSANYMNTSPGNNTNEVGDGLLGHGGTTFNVNTTDSGLSTFCGRLARPDVTDQNVFDPDPSGCGDAGTSTRPTTDILGTHATARHIAAYMTTTDPTVSGGALSYFYGLSGTTPPGISHPNYNTSPYNDKSPAVPSNARDDDLACFMTEFRAAPDGTDNRAASASKCKLSTPPSGPLFSATIADDPRFGFIPDIGAFPTGGSTAQPIVRFWAVFVYRLYTTSSNVKAMDAWVFDPALIDGAPSVSVGGGFSFQGGPAVVTLVQ